MIQGVAAANARLTLTFRQLSQGFAGGGDFSENGAAEIWPYYSAMAVFYAAHRLFTPPAFAPKTPEVLARSSWRLKRRTGRSF
jgi:hypothetical protein